MNTSPRMNATPFTANHPSSRRHALRHQHSVQRGLSTISQVCFEVARARIQVGRLISLGHLYREWGKTAQRPLKQQRGEGDHRVSERFFLRAQELIDLCRDWRVGKLTFGRTVGQVATIRWVARWLWRLEIPSFYWFVTPTAAVESRSITLDWRKQSVVSFF